MNINNKHKIDEKIFKLRQFVIHNQKLLYNYYSEQWQSPEWYKAKNNIDYNEYVSSILKQIFLLHKELEDDLGYFYFNFFDPKLKLNEGIDEHRGTQYLMDYATQKVYIDLESTKYYSLQYLLYQYILVSIIDYVKKKKILFLDKIDSNFENVLDFFKKLLSYMDQTNNSGVILISNSNFPQFGKMTKYMFYELRTKLGIILDKNDAIRYQVDPNFSNNYIELSTNTIYKYLETLVSQQMNTNNGQNQYKLGYKKKSKKRKRKQNRKKSKKKVNTNKKK